jgi:glycosyltransferase involved in cell wall biosynthesis
VRILFLAPYLPSRIRVRPFQWIKALCALGHEVHLLALRPPEDAWAAVDELVSACASVHIVPLSRARTLINGLVTPLRRLPLQFAYSHHPGAERLAVELVRRHAIDVVHIEHLRGAVMASSIRGVPLVFDAVDAIGPLFAAASRAAPGRAQRAIARLDVGRTRAFEASALRRFQRVLVTSPYEVDAFALDDDGARRRVVVLPNGVDTQYFASAWQPMNPPVVVFSGKLSYHANEAAALRLLQRIMPAVWAELPEVCVVLAGKDPSPRLRALAGDRVRLTGYVDDLRPHLWSATVAVAPLVYGAGVQNKVLEAMSCGLPVVASPEAVRALATRPGEDLLLVADADQSFAEAIVRVARNATLAGHLSGAARDYVERQHDWTRLARKLVEVYSESIADRRLPERY